ncbi:MAG: hypothetical protein GWO24_38170, partial [Akkermansiaceae bacterium]|nr:hypothetical protein [Akkermansiaceae bacterium]
MTDRRAADDGEQVFPLHIAGYSPGAGWLGNPAVWLAAAELESGQKLL